MKFLKTLKLNKKVDKAIYSLFFCKEIPYKLFPKFLHKKSYFPYIYSLFFLLILPCLNSYNIFLRIYNLRRHIGEKQKRELPAFVFKMYKKSDIPVKLNLFLLDNALVNLYNFTLYLENVRAVC